MKNIAVLLTLIFLTSLLAGCAGSDSSSENEDRISELETELTNKTVEADILRDDNIDLQQTLSEAQLLLDETNENFENISGRLVIVEWHKNNLTFALSEAMNLLNNSENQQTILLLENHINNLTSLINDTNTQIAELNDVIIVKQDQINQLTATVTALQNTISSLTYNIRDKIGSC
ncbi:MAG: hypothetical protein NLN64_06410, partial [Candidatus Thalassarchaeaceae archaeon]|nr:hypothetical protein [Candidatus Thalassarchaeaceae archaeon]